MIRRITAEQSEFFRFSEQVLGGDDAGIAELPLGCCAAGDAVNSLHCVRMTKSELDGCTAVARCLPDGRVVVRAERGKSTPRASGSWSSNSLRMDARFLPEEAAETGKARMPDARPLPAQSGDGWIRAHVEGHGGDGVNVLLNHVLDEAHNDARPDGLGAAYVVTVGSCSLHLSGDPVVPSPGQQVQHRYLRDRLRPVSPKSEDVIVERRGPGSSKEPTLRAPKGGASSARRGGSW